MIRRLLDRLMLASPDKILPRSAYAAFFVSLIFPVFFVAAVSGWKTHKDLTASALSRREAIVALASMTIKERMDRLVDLSVSLATRVRFRQAVVEGKWREAAAILKDVPVDFPAVDRIALIDPGAVLRADVPDVPSVHGKNYADRDWYVGVTREWKPYLSEAFLRRAEPRRNVVAVAVPIFDDHKRPVGILVVQILLESLFRWSAEIDPGGDGILYVTDQRGRGVFHPRIPTGEQIRDLSGSVAVKRALAGESGIVRHRDADDDKAQVTAFGPVKGYGWTVGVQQSADSVFAMRRRTLLRLTVLYGLIVAFNAGLAYLILAVVGRLRRTAGLLEVSNKELEAFSYSISHDLRTPLRGIDGFSRILLEDHAPQLGEAGRENLDRIRAAAQRMGRLIDDILALSRLSSVELKPRPVDLSFLAQSVLAELRASQPGRGVDVSVQPGIVARGDPALLEILLRNLLGNAWKFTSRRERARIEFGLENRRGRQVFFVRDNGEGFDPAYAGKLFGVFQRLHNVEEFPGTGIGLATVQRVVRRHSGSVWAQSEVGKGATFFFTLWSKLPESR